MFLVLTLVKSLLTRSCQEVKFPFRCRFDPAESGRSRPRPPVTPIARFLEFKCSVSPAPRAQTDTRVGGGRLGCVTLPTATTRSDRPLGCGVRRAHYQGVTGRCRRRQHCTYRQPATESDVEAAPHPPRLPDPILITSSPPDPRLIASSHLMNQPGAASPCSWWRRRAGTTWYRHPRRLLSSWRQRVCGTSGRDRSSPHRGVRRPRRYRGRRRVVAGRTGRRRRGRCTWRSSGCVTPARGRSRLKICRTSC